MSKVTEEMMKVFMSECAVGGHARGLQRLFDANLIALPVNEAAIRESVVQEAMALFEGDGFMLHSSHVKTHLQSLLPTKDRARELVQQYCDLGGYELGTIFDPVEFARWLIEREGANG